MHLLETMSSSPISTEELNLFPLSLWRPYDVPRFYISSSISWIHFWWYLQSSPVGYLDYPTNIWNSQYHHLLMLSPTMNPFSVISEENLAFITCEIKFLSLPPICFWYNQPDGFRQQWIAAFLKLLMFLLQCF